MQSLFMYWPMTRCFYTLQSFLVHHTVFRLNSLRPQRTSGFLHCHLSCSHITNHLPTTPIRMPAVAIRTHSLWRSIWVKKQSLAPLGQVTSPLWDVVTTKPEEPIRSLWSYLTGLLATGPKNWFLQAMPGAEIWNERFVLNLLHH